MQFQTCRAMNAFVARRSDAPHTGCLNATPNKRGVRFLLILRRIADPFWAILHNADLFRCLMRTSVRASKNLSPSTLRRASVRNPIAKTTQRAWTA
jgi:hypothetical protein